MSTRTIIVLSGLVALVLAIIGIRFLIVPVDALRTFGLGKAPDVFALAAIVGIRDLWLAALAAALTWLREWRALALWFAFGAVVCWADATLVASRNGPAAAIAFHAISGVICALLGGAIWHRHRGSGRR